MMGQQTQALHAKIKTIKSKNKIAVTNVDSFLHQANSTESDRTVSQIPVT